MKKTILLFLGAFLTLNATSAITAEKIAVVVSAESKMTVTQSDIFSIFLSIKKTLADGTSVNPMGHREGTKIYKEFYQAVALKSPGKMRLYWARQVMKKAGLPPPEATDVASLKAAIAKDPHAIGYIYAAEVDPTLKTVKELEIK